jgi:hypothetical protein
MSRRLRVLAATPLFGTSLVSTLIFIGNHKEIGVIYAKRLVVEVGIGMQVGCPRG